MSAVEFECLCPVCQELLTHASAVSSEEDITPREGDVTICAVCMSILEFDVELKPFQIDIKTLEPDVQDMIAMAIAHLSQHRPTLH